MFRSKKTPYVGLFPAKRSNQPLYHQRVIILPGSNCPGVWQSQGIVMQGTDHLAPIHSHKCYMRQYIHTNVMHLDIHTNVMHQYVHTNVMHQDIHTNVIQMCLAEARNRYAGNRSFGVLCTKHSCEHKCYASICCAILSIDKCYHLTCFLFTKNLWSMDSNQESGNLS